MPQFARPIQDISVGGWGVSPLWSKLSEVSPDDATTQVQSAKNPNADTFEVRVGSVLLPVNRQNHIVRVRMMTDGTGYTAQVDLYQGTTLIQSFPGQTVPPGAYGTLALNVTEASAQAITNYSDLRVRVAASGGGGKYAYCTWIELQVPDTLIQKSGTASISGRGNLLGAIRKMALIVALLSATGNVSASGQKTFRAAVSGGGTVAALATKGAAGTAVASGGYSGFAGYVSYSDNFEGSTHTGDLETYDQWERQAAFSGREFTIWGYSTLEGSWKTSRYLKKSVPQVKDFLGLQFDTVSNEGFTCYRDIVFRYVDPNNYSYLRIRGDGSAQFCDVVAGGSSYSGTYLHGSSLVWTGLTHKVRAFGTSYEYRLNGSIKLSWNGNPTRNAAGDVGLGGSSQYQYQGGFDNLLLETDIPIPSAGGKKDTAGTATLSGGGTLSVITRENSWSSPVSISDNGTVTVVGAKGAIKRDAPLPALRFDGAAGSFAEVFPEDDALGLSFPFAVETWARYRGVTANTSYITVGLADAVWGSTRRSVGVRKFSGSYWYVEFYEWMTDGNPPWDGWAHVVYSFPAPNRIEFFVNGVFNFGFTWASSNVGFSPGRMAIGAKSGNSLGADRWIGDLALVRVFKETLDATKIAQLYNSGKGVPSTPSFATPVVEFLLKEGSGSRIDSTASGHYANLPAGISWIEGPLFAPFLSGGGFTTCAGGRGANAEHTRWTAYEDDFERPDGYVGNGWDARPETPVDTYPLWGISQGKLYTPSVQSKLYWATVPPSEFFEITVEHFNPVASPGDSIQIMGRLGCDGIDGQDLLGGWALVYSSDTDRWAYVYYNASHIYGVATWFPAGANKPINGDLITLKILKGRFPVIEGWLNSTLIFRYIDTENLVDGPGYAGFQVTGPNQTNRRSEKVVVQTGIPLSGVTVYGGGSLVTSGWREANVAASLSGGGNLYASVREEAYRTFSLSGGGTVSVGIARGVRKSTSVSGGGSTTAGGFKGGTGIVTVSGGGTFSGTGDVDAGTFVWVLIRGGGSPAAVGRKEARAPPVLSGGGNLSVRFERSWPLFDLTAPADTDSTALLVLIELDWCGRTFGVAPCLATGTPCYNTWRTCKFITAYQNVGRTYRFCSADFPQVFDDARPYVTSVRWMPTEIKTNLTVNARVVIEMADEPDTDVGIDPYWNQRVVHPGTFWKKFLARNVNYKGRTLKVYEGRPGAPESTYILRWIGKLDNITVKGAKVSIESVDLLKDLAKIEVPPKVNAKLAADVASDYTLGISLTEDADKFPSSGYVRIDDEILRYESKDDTTKQLMTLSRGQFGTTSEGHTAKTKVQPVRYFAPKSGFDHLLDMLLVDAGIDPVYIDAGSFVYYREWPDRDIDFTAVVSEPKKLSDLFFEVVDLLDAKAWVAENLKITIRRNVQNAPGRSYHAISDEDDITIHSGSVDLNEKSRITRVSIYWDKVATAKDDESTSYRRLDIAVDPDAEDNYDGVIEKKVLCRWIDPISGEEGKIGRFVQNLGLRRITRQRDAQPLITAELPPKDAEVLTGDYVRLSTDELLDEDGSPITRRIFQVVKRDRKEDKFSLTLLQVARRRVCIICPAGFPDYGSATESQKEYGFITDSKGKMSDNTDGYYVW